MKNKVKAKIFGLLKKSEGIRDYKLIVLDFEEWVNNNEAMGELRNMTGKEVVSIMREVWEECKSIN